jgi:hypothetical protein
MRTRTLRYPEIEGVMATQNGIHVSDELLAELQAKSAVEGKTVDELAEEALASEQSENSSFSQ